MLVADPSTARRERPLALPGGREGSDVPTQVRAHVLCGRLRLFKRETEVSLAHLVRLRQHERKQTETRNPYGPPSASPALRENGPPRSRPLESASVPLWRRARGGVTREGRDAARRHGAEQLQLSRYLPRTASRRLRWPLPGGRCLRRHSQWEARSSVGAGQ